MSVPVEDHHGHRGRLRERLLEMGGASLLDYELLEALLAALRPRVDTKPAAKALLRAFDDLPAVISADTASLAKVDDVGPASVAAIKIVEAIALRMLHREASARPVLANWQALLDYLHADMAHRPVERVRVLHLNGRNMLISDELVSEGTIDQSAVHVREVIRRALDLGSAAVILAHNHPSGDPSPSRADIDVTREIVAAGKPLGIAVHDHVIIGRSGHASLRSLGLI